MLLTLISCKEKHLFIFTSTVALLGFLPQDIIGSSIFESYHPDDLPQLLDIYKKGELIMHVFIADLDRNYMHCECLIARYTLLLMDIYYFHCLRFLTQ